MARPRRNRSRRGDEPHCVWCGSTAGLEPVPLVGMASVLACAEHRLYVQAGVAGARVGLGQLWQWKGAHLFERVKQARFVQRFLSR